ncbi:hypothetical protein DXG01_015608 [Tephrocybe rancida]|nr:hypothetical protein DXG01_015608 [Tephrocybe rancida]
MRLPWNGVEIDNVHHLFWHISQKYHSSDNSATSVLQTDDITSPNSTSIIVEPSPPQEGNEANRVSALYALIVGIDKYQDPEIPTLHGAVSDADAVKDFLVTMVHASEGRIINLRNEQATREKMLEALQKLADNSAIKTNDPILIYYAGHGGQAPAPSGWKTTTGMIQMLLPYDFKFNGSGGKDGQGILDIELRQILMDLSQKKSDNITVIFDCCHSGSGTRKNPNDKTRAIRGIGLPLDYNIPVAVFRPEVDPSLGPSTSHVLLAACKPDQFAVERNCHGAFTLALLNLLSDEGVDKLTYADIIMRLPDLSMQNPICEGANRDRILFNSEVHARRVVYLIKQRHAGVYTLLAGEAHGLTKGAQFTVYSDQHMSKEFGSVIVTRTDPFTSLCSSDLPFDLSNPAQSAYAVQTHVGVEQDLCLFIELNVAFLDLFTRLYEEMHSQDSKHKRSVRLVDTELDKPELVLRARQNVVQFELMDQTCRDYGLTHMPFYNVSTNDPSLLSILRRAADFYWHLRHSNKNGSLAKDVHLECLELELSKSLHIPKTGGENLIRNSTITIENGCAPVQPISDLDYFWAQSAGAVLGPSNTSYLVQRTSESTGQSGDCIPAHKSLYIGYGDSERNPISYFLPEGQNVDVGFVKLYVSTKHVDYSTILQRSSFVHQRGSSGDDPKKTKYTNTRDNWDTVTTPIIIRGHAASGSVAQVEAERAEDVLAQSGAPSVVSVGDGAVGGGPTPVPASQELEVGVGDASAAAGSTTKRGPDDPVAPPPERHEVPAGVRDGPEILGLLMFPLMRLLGWRG